MRNWFLIMNFAFLGCSDPPVPIIDEEQVKRELIIANRDKQKMEADSLKTFISSKGWTMKVTPTGLYYEVMSSKQGRKINNGDFVSLFYKVYLLNGQLCYDNYLGHPIRFKVGEDHVETGLHQLMPMLGVGDEVRVVMPSHLAFGFTGDSNKIPGDSPLYYEIKVVSVQ